MADFFPMKDIQWNKFQFFAPAQLSCFKHSPYPSLLFDFCGLCNTQRFSGLKKILAKCNRIIFLLLLAIFFITWLTPLYNSHDNPTHILSRNSFAKVRQRETVNGKKLIKLESKSWNTSREWCRWKLKNASYLFSAIKSHSILVWNVISFFILTSKFKYLQSICSS